MTRLAPSPPAPRGHDVLAAPALRLAHVSVRYAGHRGSTGRTAVGDVSLEIPPGQRVAVLGPNGSGKSTLFRAICALLTPDEGVIELFGEGDPRRRLRSLGVVFQSDSLDPYLTARENLRDQALLFGINRRDVAALVDRSLRDAGLLARADEPVKRLSGGLARRVDLCRALLHGPHLLLLDEPTVGLDPAARESFLAALEAAQRARGMTVVMSTHLIDEADRQDRVVFLHEGRVMADDAPAALRRRLGSAIFTVLDARWQPPEEERHAWQQIGGTWTRPVDDSDARATSEFAARLAGAQVPFTFAPPTLADVFAHVTGASLGDSRDAATKNEDDAA